MIEFELGKYTIIFQGDYILIDSPWRIHGITITNETISFVKLDGYPDSLIEFIKRLLKNKAFL